MATGLLMAALLQHIICHQDNSMSHEACVNNKECLGFRARENRTAGDLFGNNQPCPGWFRLPEA